MITIIDYGVGNLGSISNMLNKIGHKCIITSDQGKINSAEKLILPGVGSFDKCMQNLQESKLINTLNQRVLIDKIPILGICVGMQLMTNHSEEGKIKGLNWVDAQVIKFKSDELKVPHMGWNIINHTKKSILFTELTSEKRFYFVHSYYVSCNNKSDILTTTPYCTNFVSSFEKNNIFGVQFHPEKSHKFGMHLIENFAKEDALC